jgi:hypothetical protein
MKPLGRALHVVLALVCLAACGTQTSGPGAADEPTATPSTPATGEPTPSATASTSTTPEPTASEPATTDALTLDGLSRGEAPHIPYLALDDAGGWTLVEPDGTTRALDRPYTTFATMGDGLVATSWSDEAIRAYVLDGDLREVSSTDIRGGQLAATPDGEIVAWLGTDGRPHVVEQGGAQEYDLNPVPRNGDHVAAVVSDGTTCREGEGGQGCAVFVDSADASRSWVSVSHGIVDEVAGVKAINDVSPHGMLGLTSVSDEGSCWGRFPSSKPQPVWETCDYTLFSYNEAGTRILAGPAYLDGFGQGFAAVLDDTDGHVAAEWHSKAQLALLGTVWEDDDHVLAMVFQDDEWAVLRLDVADGSVELAVPPVPDRPGAMPFVLPTV